MLPAACEVSGGGLADAMEGIDSALSIVARDAFGNAQRGGGAAFEATARHSLNLISY